MTDCGVPVVPAISDEIALDHVDAHAALSAAHRFASADARRLFVAVQRRLLVESLAYLQPVVARPADPMLFPPPRAFLTEPQRLRLLGAEAAFRHLDSRAAMWVNGAVSTIVEPTTPLALHALLEGLLPSGRETNAGMWRVTPTAWQPGASDFQHVDASEVPGLAAEAIDIANSADAPAFVRAAWLTFTMLSIHPFVDGNGRTSRALALGIAAEGLDLGVDWGILEQWSIARSRYIEALQAGQGIPRYRGVELDARPFVEFSAAASAAGARLCARRLHAIETDLRTLAESGLTSPAAVVLVATNAWGGLGPDDGDALGVGAVEFGSATTELLDRNLVAWQPRPASRRSARVASSHILVPQRF